ncbi:MAG: MexH family multidrug efflux RND transporter periplasmic adaptor subunit [Gammaproteobacteria bacterium]
MKLTLARRKSTFVIIILALAVCAGGAYYWSKRSGHGAPPSFPTAVEAESAQSEMWESQINATGSIVGEQGIVVKPEVAGIITDIFFKSGTFVKQGQPLIQINPSVLQAQLQSDQAALLLSQQDYARMKDLFNKKVQPQSALDKAQATLEQAKSQVVKTQAQLEQLLIKAPFDGKLGLRQVSLGEYLSPGQAIVNLEQLNPLRVDFSVPETYLRQLANGQQVIITTRTFPNRQFKGTVYAYDSAINSRNRSLGVRATIPNDDLALLPGTFVRVELLLGKPEPVVTVPATAIVYSDEGAFLYIVQNQQAVRIPVEIGARRNNRVVILEGVNAGDMVITAGQLKIGDGSRVMITNQIKPNAHK